MLSKRSNNFKNRIGEVVELKAILWLAEQGFEVYRNNFRTGPADLIAMSPDGQLTAIDVKKVADAERNDNRINHPRKTEEQQLLNICLLYYNEKTDFFGWSMDEIYCNVGRNYVPASEKNKKDQHIDDVVFDRKFSSLGDIARHYKINYRSLTERQRRLNESVEQSVTALLNNSKSTTVLGKQFSNRKEACRYYDVNPTSVEERMRTKGETVDESVSHFIERNRKRASEGN